MGLQDPTIPQENQPRGASTRQGGAQCPRPSTMHSETWQVRSKAEEAGRRTKRKPGYTQAWSPSVAVRGRAAWHPRLSCWPAQQAPAPCVKRPKPTRVLAHRMVLQGGVAALQEEAKGCKGLEILDRCEGGRAGEGADNKQESPGYPGGAKGSLSPGS